MVVICEYLEEIIIVFQCSFGSLEQFLCIYLYVLDVEWVDGEVVMCIGFIVNELAINFCKYVFVEQLNFEINVVLQFEIEGCYCFIYIDNGSGLFVDFQVDMKQLMGFFLFYNLVKQFNGCIVFFGEKGICVECEFNLKVV